MRQTSIGTFRATLEFRTQKWSAAAVRPDSGWFGTRGLRLFSWLERLVLLIHDGGNTTTPVVDKLMVPDGIGRGGK